MCNKTYLLYYITVYKYIIFISVANINILATLLIAKPLFFSSSLIFFFDVGGYPSY